MRLGLVGLGDFQVAIHAPSIIKYRSEVAPVDLVICNRSEENLKIWQEQFGVFPSFMNVDEMIGKAKLDAAYVVVQPEMCCETVCKFLKARIPVFTEKPPGLNLEEINKMIENSKGVPHAVGFNRRFSPFVRKLKEIASERIKLPAIFTGCTFVRTARYDRDFGGRTLIHGIDCMRYISGDYIDFDVKSHYRTGAQPFENFCISGRQTGSALSMIACFPVSGMDAERYYVVGEDVTVEARFAAETDKGQVCVYSKGVQEKMYTEKDLGLEGVPHFIHGGFFAQTKQFLDAVAKGGNPGTSFQESLQTVKLVDNLRKASEENKKLEAIERNSI